MHLNFHHHTGVQKRRQQQAAQKAEGSPTLLNKGSVRSHERTRKGFVRVMSDAAGLCLHTDTTTRQASFSLRDSSLPEPPEPAERTDEWVPDALDLADVLLVLQAHT